MAALTPKAKPFRPLDGAWVREKFGPLGETTQDTSRWAWISDPWPWEKEGN